MSDEQLKQAAAIDIRYFTMAYKFCPTCGIEFAKCHPSMNLMPHWYSNCEQKTKGVENDVQRTS